MTVGAVVEFSYRIHVGPAGDVRVSAASAKTLGMPKPRIRIATRREKGGALSAAGAGDETWTPLVPDFTQRPPAFRAKAGTGPSCQSDAASECRVDIEF